MHILVTGGAGYIGSHACKALAAAGHTPVTVDNLTRGFRELVKWGPLEQGDVLDGAWLRDVIRRYTPSAVFHFAGYISVPESVSQPELYQRNNVEGFKSLIDAMQGNVQHLVLSSSCAVHGVPKSVPIREGDPCNPINPYGQNKWAMEQMAHEQARIHGTRYMILRYFNASGADAAGETGELHEPETHAIPLAIQAALHGTPFNVYGADYPTPDRTAIRDYIHVTDLAHAHLLALNHLLAGKPSDTVNIGTGMGTSVAEMIQAVERTSGARLKLNVTERRTGDPPVLVADPSRATELLGFTPIHSDMDTIIRTAWNWHGSR